MGVPSPVPDVTPDPTRATAAIEWEEWGNPTEKEYYDYMKSYSPVDNIQPANYPHILVTAGLHDPRVGAWWERCVVPAQEACAMDRRRRSGRRSPGSPYSRTQAPGRRRSLGPPPSTPPPLLPLASCAGYWEPAKFVAKLRQARTDQGKLLLFKCDLGAGHFSQSGRFDKLKERATEIAFLLKACGKLSDRIAKL